MPDLRCYPLSRRFVSLDGPVVLGHVKPVNRLGAAQSGRGISNRSLSQIVNVLNLKCQAPDIISLRWPWPGLARVSADSHGS